MNLEAEKGISFYKKLAIAVLAISLATVVALIFPPLRSGGGMYFLYLTVIVFASLYGGFWLGSLTAVISFAICFFIALSTKSSLTAMGDWLVLLAFALASGFTVLLCHTKVATETALREAENKYRMIFEDAITGIYETTIDGKYAAANPKLARMFGYESPAALIQETEDLNRNFYVEADRREKFTQLVETGGNITGFESEIYRRDGAKIWISENSVAVRDKKGKIIGFQGTTIETTDRKLAEAELQKARDELEEKVAERTAELARTNEILMAEIAERQRIENKLLTSQKQLRDLSAHLESVREEERKYLARELHDELGQTLTALKIDLTKLGEKMPNVQNENVRLQILERIPAMIVIVDMAMETTRKITAELRPGILDELGLVAAAEWLVQEFQKRTGIKCGLKIDFEDKDFPQNIKTAMFRILQECLTNITRHAAAQNVKIELKNSSEFLLLMVEDNGRGIDGEKLETTKSFGITGMQERALLLEGTLEISHPEKGGTRVTVQIPQQINESLP